MIVKKHTPEGTEDAAARLVRSEFSTLPDVTSPLDGVPPNGKELGTTTLGMDKY